MRWAGLAIITKTGIIVVIVICFHVFLLGVGQTIVTEIGEVVGRKCFTIITKACIVVVILPIVVFFMMWIIFDVRKIESIPERFDLEIFPQGIKILLKVMKEFSTMVTIASQTWCMIITNVCIFWCIFDNSNR